MEFTLLSLVQPPPPGFTHRDRLTTAEVRRQAFALFAPSLAAAETALAPWTGKAHGIIITTAPQVNITRTDAGWWHLTLRPADLATLPDWMRVVMPLMAGELQEAERRQTLSLEVERLAADRAQAAAEFTHFRASLLAENHERRRIELALRASEVRFRTIYNSVSDAIFIHHAHTGDILEVNQRACELFGYSEEELKRLRVPDLSDLDTEYGEERAMTRIHGALQQTQSFTWHSRHKSGRLFWSEVHMRSAFILGVESVLVTVRDISDRKAAEETQHRLEAQLLQTQKLESLGVLAGGIAHDFNNLLLTILGNVDLAVAELSPTAPGRNYLTEIEGAARRAADLCRQMLAYAGKGRFVVQAISLNELIREMDHLLEVSTSKKASLRYHLADQVPAIHADTTQIRQIIMNLVTNASEAIGDHVGTITVSTGTTTLTRADLAACTLGAGLPEGCYAYIEVADTGCGMPPDMLPKVFDPFFSTKFTGRGLGLATVYGLVRSHQGALQLESAPGRGTTFRVLLPALQQSAAPAEAPTDAAWRGQGTVLVVDDEESVRTFTRHALEKSGFSVLLAEDGQKAVELFQARPQAPGTPDEIVCALLDLTMPRMDGEETFRALRARQANLPVIVTSGYSEQEVVPRFGHETRIGFLQKPYRAAGLRAALKNLLTPG